MGRLELNVSPWLRAEGARRGLTGSCVSPERSIQAQQGLRDTSPALLSWGSDSAPLSRLTACCPRPVASLGRAIPRLLHTLFHHSPSLGAHPFFPITTDFPTARLEYLSNPEPPLDLVCFPHGMQELYEHLQSRHLELGDSKLSEVPCHRTFAHTIPLVWCLFP